MAFAFDSRLARLELFQGSESAPRGEANVNLQPIGSGRWSSATPSWQPLEQPQALIPLQQLHHEFNYQGPANNHRYSGYQGNLSLSGNQSANIQESESMSVYITNLPLDCDAHMLLAAIRGVGKIFACNVGPPDTNHSTACAKVVFFERAETGRLLDKVSRGEFRVGNYLPHVTMNRTRVQAEGPSNRSRVILVSGPAEIINRPYLEALFQRHCYYNMDEVLNVMEGAGGLPAFLEFRFSSWRAQASKAFEVCEKARQGIAKFTAGMSDEEKTLWRSARVRWGQDPCAGEGS
ncbi:Uu.00g140540.m01.CDS01 [Anthostomella pinea]|uniref:Uu.00g140540.m01.CDS01 n=1 Tax=Anthostomella pinea TaxID=933095 RepID=A0AAI8VR12_9PEZI|nr:Uu.00g140540.m01.CDS01 [Anthostomella pinea]